MCCVPRTISRLRMLEREIVGRQNASFCIFVGLALTGQSLLLSKTKRLFALALFLED